MKPRSDSPQKGRSRKIAKISTKDIVAATFLAGIIAFLKRVISSLSLRLDDVKAVSGNRTLIVLKLGKSPDLCLGIPNRKFSLHEQ